MLIKPGPHSGEADGRTHKSETKKVQFWKMSVARSLGRRVRDGSLLYDGAQASAAEVLDSALRGVNAGIPLWAHRGLLWRLQRPTGVYLSGAVGCGKTMLMDTFFSEAENMGLQSRRLHYHAFASETHWRLSGQRGSSSQHKLRQVGRDFAADMRVLCLDEVAVHDVADALILREVFEEMLRNGMCVVCTSNRSPRDLYEHGINRDLFLPFVKILEDRLQHCQLPAKLDYRRNAEKNEENSLFVVDDDEKFRAAAESILGKAPLQTIERSLPLPGGRSIRRLRSCGNSFVRNAFLSFDDLCRQPLSAADYAILADNYDVLFLDRVPRLCVERHDEARRFLTLVDVFYDRKKLIGLHAAAPIDDLLASTQPQQTPKTISVKDEGGSSGRSSTYFGDAEWSATGLIGASLGGFAGIQDTQFAWDRLTSRLVEITSTTNYRRQWLDDNDGTTTMTPPKEKK